jgi:hypothetical protein
VTAARRFGPGVLDAVRDAMVVGIQAGSRPHRVIAVWAVVVEGRVFVRSWSIKPGGWFRTLQQQPRGTLHVGGRARPVRAVFTRSERLKDAVDEAYAEKYRTPGSLKYVRDLCGRRSRATTTELAPR